MKAPILFSWALIWFGTILVANSDRSAVQAGVFLWVAGILVQYGMACIRFIGRPSSGVPVERPKPRLPARV